MPITVESPGIICIIITKSHRFPIHARKVYVRHQNAIGTQILVCRFRPCVQSFGGIDGVSSIVRNSVILQEDIAAACSTVSPINAFRHLHLKPMVENGDVVGIDIARLPLGITFQGVVKRTVGLAVLLGSKGQQPCTCRHILRDDKGFVGSEGSLPAWLWQGGA